MNRNVGGKLGGCLDLRPHQLAETRQVGGRDHVVHASLGAPDDASDPWHRPWSLPHQRDEVGAVDAVHDQTGAPVHHRRAIDVRDVDAAVRGGAHRSRLALDAPRIARSAQQAQDRPVVPREDVRLPSLADANAAGGLALGHASTARG